MIDSAKIIELRQEGYTILTICAITGHAKSTVEIVLKRAGLTKEEKRNQQIKMDAEETLKRWSLAMPWI